MSNLTDSSSDDDCYGPALPPNFKKAETSTSAFKSSLPIGPVIPPSMRHLLDVKATSTSSADHKVHNHNDGVQSINDDGDSDSDSEIIGPLPPDHPKAKKTPEVRGLLQLSGEMSKPKREEWMLIPPKNKPIASLGLASRKFLARTPADFQPDDQDEEEAEEELERAAIEQQIIDQYDEQMEKMKNSVAGEKRGAETLLQIHQKELKRKRKEEEKQGPAERKPFNRDRDLKVSGLSSDDRMKYIQKSRELDTRFMKGKSKFL